MVLLPQKEIQISCSNSSALGGTERNFANSYLDYNGAYVKKMGGTSFYQVLQKRVVSPQGRSHFTMFI